MKSPKHEISPNEVESQTARVRRPFQASFIQACIGRGIAFTSGIRFSSLGIRACCCGLVLSLGVSTRAMDWPYYRGSEHTGVSADRIVSAFPAEGPPQLWKVPLDPAFSSFTVSGGRAFTQVRRTVGGLDSEVCLALSAGSGEELWATRVDRAEYDGGSGEEEGPRSTPCVDGSSVYVLTSWLKLTKLNAATGGILWQKDLIALYGGQGIAWQNAASPLLDGDYIYVNCNSSTGSLLALRKTDGSLAWRTGSDRLTHATPVPATIFGTRQIIFFTQAGLVAVDAGSGAELWRYAFPFNTSSAASPVVDGDIVYCSAAYAVGTGAVRISKSGSQFVASQLWPRNASLMNQWTTPVAVGGYLYGLFGASYSSTAPLKCIELTTGTQMWSKTGFGPGGVLLVDGKLLVTDIRGAVVLVETYPRAYNELARFQAVSGTCWNSPAVCDGRLYTRSIREAACFNIAPPSPLAQSLTPLADGRFCLRIGPADGQPLDAGRAAALQLLSSTSLAEPFANWVPVTESLTLTNGLLEGYFDASDRERYFIVLEQP